ncbi:hypothetical protein ACFU53_13675 [Streptomyces sp. NPDC057474]|uniref:hypothetical protein n=1 Tax=Streptomyces sp. NPDC057474 TaxID=3346144 RepID=UPI00369E48BF
MERRWFRRDLAGQDALALFSSTADSDEDFDGATDNPRVVAAAWEVWRTEVAFAEQFVTEAMGSRLQLAVPTPTDPEPKPEVAAA